MESTSLPNIYNLHRYAFPIWIIILSSVSCVNTKRTGLVLIKKNQVLYESGSTGSPNDRNYRAYAYKVNLSKTVPALLFTNPDGTMNPSTIQFVDPTIDAILTSDDPNQPAAGVQLQSKAYYFPIDQNPLAQPLTGSGPTVLSKPFHYIDIRPVWQAITIPIKYRPALSGGRAADASASVNLGPSYGWKFTHYTFRRIYNVTDPANKIYAKLNDHTSQWAIAPGVFFTPTVVALDSLHTSGKILTAENKIGTTYGIFCVFGYNDFNLGVAGGIDNTYGSGAGKWWYNGQPWIGVVFSIDFFK